MDEVKSDLIDSATPTGYRTGTTEGGKDKNDHTFPISSNILSGRKCPQ